MLITKITIENFKCIKEPVSLELKPITLLFGPNSAGKSTIVQALHYACEIFERENLNPVRTMSGGNSVDLGGFRNFVHNHDIRLPIRLRFDFSFDSDDANFLPYLSGLDYETPESEHFLNFLWDLAEVSLTPWVEITVRWSSVLKMPFISSCKIGYDQKLFLEITTSDDRKKQVISFLDLKSPVFHTTDGLSIVHSYLAPAILDEENNIIELNVLYAGFIPQPQLVIPDLYNWHPNGKQDIPIFRTTENFAALLTALLISPIEYLREQLRLFRFIGPLRKVPDRGYAYSLTNPQSSWNDGIAAWNLLWEHLQKSDRSFVDKVNNWLLNKLKTGYIVETSQYREVDSISPFTEAVLQGANIEHDLRDQFASILVKHKISLRERNRNISVLPTDIGVGISQILPVIVLALKFDRGILAIEQPELHIHPALQVALGDLFIEEINSENNMNGGKIFLLETHSEHLLLRLLRRIRETGEQNAPENGTLTSSKLSIYFIERAESGISCIPIRVNEDGDFIDPWPKGFFAERAEELF